MTIEITGNWRRGHAFDVHTLSSTYLGPNELGHAQYENVRSEMGELVYQLKYRRDQSKLDDIVKLLDKIKGIEQFDFLMPIPPTDKSRQFQPVTEIAVALGKRHGVTVLVDFLEKGTRRASAKECQRPRRKEKTFAGVTPNCSSLLD